MPFTLAHPAAVLPLRNRFPRVLPWSALVIGSITPDLQYFLLGIIPGNGHSIPGLVRFCLPVGMVVWLIFHLLLKRPLAYLLPEGERSVLWPLARRRVDLSLRSFVAVAVALIVGAATHLLWDAFTHQGRWGVEHIPALSRSIMSIQGYDFTVFRLLQHGSTVVALILLAVSYRRWRQSRDAVDSATPAFAPKWKFISIALIVVIPTTAALVYALTGAVAVTDLLTFRSFLWRFITSGFGFGLLTLVAFSTVVTLAERR